MSTEDWINQKATVYAVVDMVTNDVVYVGRTVNWNGRMSVHRGCNGKYKNHRFFALETVYWFEAGTTEKVWIRYLLSIGCPLDNKHVPQGIIRQDTSIGIRPKDYNPRIIEGLPPRFGYGEPAVEARS